MWNQPMWKLALCLITIPPWLALCALKHRSSLPQCPCLSLFSHTPFLLGFLPFCLETSQLHLHGTPSVVTLLLWFQICLTCEVPNISLLDKMLIWWIWGEPILQLLTVATFDSPNYLSWELDGGVNGCLQPLFVDWILALPLPQLHRFWVLMWFLILLAFLSHVANQSSSLVGCFFMLFF